eukprot:1159926-Pelagomonas_calceolata.AAC.11
MASIAGAVSLKKELIKVQLIKYGAQESCTAHHLPRQPIQRSPAGLLREDALHGIHEGSCFHKLLKNMHYLKGRGKMRCMASQEKEEKKEQTTPAKTKPHYLQGRGKMRCMASRTVSWLALNSTCVQGSSTTMLEPHTCCSMSR